RVTRQRRAYRLRGHHQRPAQPWERREELRSEQSLEMRAKAQLSERLAGASEGKLRRSEHKRKLSSKHNSKPSNRPKLRHEPNPVWTISKRRTAPAWMRRVIQ